MKEKEETFDIDAFKEKALEVEGLQNGQPMMGEDGVLAPLMKHLTGILLGG